MFLLFQATIFRFHVRFRGCRKWVSLSSVTPSSNSSQLTSGDWHVKASCQALLDLTWVKLKLTCLGYFGGQKSALAHKDLRLFQHTFGTPGVCSTGVLSFTWKGEWKWAPIQYFVCFHVGCIYEYMYTLKVGCSVESDSNGGVKTSNWAMKQGTLFV